MTDPAGSRAVRGNAGPEPAAPALAGPLLDVRDLRTYFHTDAGDAKAVDGISFSIDAGKTLAVVGESGCGKTVTALSVLQLIPRPPGEFVSGEIRLAGRDLLKLSPSELRGIRGGQIAMIFQEPGTSLNPVFTVGAQIAEAIALHRRLPRSKIGDEVVRSLRAVHVSDPERRIHQYPHELSGGMKQRVMIAMALSCNPQLLIADEPTTAVDVTIQARILELLKSIQSERGMAILLITHDLGVVAELADDVVVMYAGKIIEQGPVQEVFDRPRHPYTLGLFASLPRIDQKKTRLEAIEGSVPAATRFPEGCRFRERCRWALPECASEPPLVTIGNSHLVACWRQEEIAAQFPRDGAGGLDGSKSNPKSEFPNPK
jgi:oligopeptide/dipeptide ABC transporter ATP-binding protein